MKRSLALSVVALLIVSMFPLGLHAEAAKPRPQVWMGPPGREDGKVFRELFDHPDQWVQTRAGIDGLLYADHVLNKQFNDDELRTFFAAMNKWGLKLQLDVGAVKPWGITGEKVFGIEQPKWERFIRLGAPLESIAMDEPLTCCRTALHKDDEYAAEQTADFIALVRQHFPKLRVGEIETYPTIPLADHYAWIEALNKHLADKNVHAIDFYRLDVNWAVFTAFNKGSWLEVRDLERWCRKHKVPFSLIYWASDIGPMAKRGLADDSTWYVSMMRQGYDYALVQGDPDEYILQSWTPFPSTAVPESARWSLSRSVLDFTNKFIRREP